MPPRDEQDYENRRQQIIDGALHVFADKGFERATKAAGIGSPGLIYHYFKDKSDLLRQVVEQRSPVLRLLNNTEAMMDLPPQEALKLFATAFVETMNNRAAIGLLKIILGEALRRPAVASMINTIGPGRGIAFLRSYLERQMAAGTMRRMDSGAAARCFIGPLLAFVLTREVFQQPDSPSLSPETMVEAAVTIFLEGMRPDSSPEH
jgi:TetR/AcrR family transcriptional regulator, mexJK operon transcriptional repressor